MLPFSWVRSSASGWLRFLSAFATDQFATEIRAHASARKRHGFGKACSVLGPRHRRVVVATTGLLASTGSDVSVLALLNLAVLPIVWLPLPETRNLAFDPDGRLARNVQVGGDALRLMYEPR